MKAVEETRGNGGSQEARIFEKKGRWTGLKEAVTGMDDKKISGTAKTGTFKNCCVLQRLSIFCALAVRVELSQFYLPRSALPTLSLRLACHLDCHHQSLRSRI